MADSLSFDAAPDPSGPSAAGLGWRLLRAAGSLKITVVMFIAATFLLFVGTLAQDEKNLPEVKAEYFTSWLARIPFADFLPVTIFGETHVPGWFPFPGGAAIGLVLLANLIAAKATRFQVAAHGKRLLWGAVVSLIGGLLTAGVILTGGRPWTTTRSGSSCRWARRRWPAASARRPGRPGAGWCRARSGPPPSSSESWWPPRWWAASPGG